MPKETRMKILDWLLSRVEEQPTGMIPNPEQDEDPRNLRYEDIAPMGAGYVPPAGDIEKGDWTLNQGRSSSCTCHSTVCAINQMMGAELSPRYAWRMIKSDPKYPSSRLGWGAYMVDSLKLMKNEGICTLEFAPNDETGSDRDYADLDITQGMEISAGRHKGGSYVYVTTGAKDNLTRFDEIVRYLHEQQKPVKVGVEWRKSFNNARKGGVVPATAPSGSSAGHDMVAVAWRRINGHEYLGFRNSFGETWGDRGRVWLPKGFTKISSAIAYLPPDATEELEITQPTPIEVPRNLHQERANAQALKAMIDVKFPANVEKEAAILNAKARGIAGAQWLVLVPAVTYRGWTFTDVINYLYARSRNKVSEDAYNFVFNHTRTV